MEIQGNGRNNRECCIRSNQSRQNWLPNEQRRQTIIGGEVIFTQNATTMKKKTISFFAVAPDKTAIKRDANKPTL